MMGTRDYKTCLYVCNIMNDDNMTNIHKNKHELIYLFEKYGPIHNIDIMNNYDCKIEFENHIDAQKAKRGLNYCDFNGRRLIIEWYNNNMYSNFREPLLQGLNWRNGYPGQPRYINRLILLNLPFNMDHATLLVSILYHI